MHYKTSVILKFLQSYGHLKIAILYGDCMKSGCIGKSNTNNLPAPTDLTENPNGKKNIFFNDATQKSATLVDPEIAVKVQQTWPIFEKCPHLRENGGVLTKIWAHGE
jgi:hypothetical protein